MTKAIIRPQRIHVFDNAIYKDSETEVWVFQIKKKELLALGVTILKSKNFNATWGFLMSIEDGEKVKEKFGTYDTNKSI